MVQMMVLNLTLMMAHLLVKHREGISRVNYLEGLLNGATEGVPDGAIEGIIEVDLA